MLDPESSQIPKPQAATLLEQAAALLEGPDCVWCEINPKAARSHLCESCRTQAAAGALSR